MGPWKPGGEKINIEDYGTKCILAAVDQGLGAFLKLEGWEVEQTGGFTMVAVKRITDNLAWSVTDEDDGFMAACWDWDHRYEVGEPEGIIYHEGLSLEQVLTLTK